MNVTPHSFDPVESYAKAVLAGEIPAGPLVRAACQRHLNDLEKAKGDWLYRFDLNKALKALNFFPEMLVLTDGDKAGVPFTLQPWQQFIVGSLFGWVKKADGYRRFRTAYAEISKGSGKSPMAGGIGIYGLVADGEMGAEIYAAATKLDQAKILFRDAERMVEHSPVLPRIITKHQNNLSVIKTSSFFRPISSEKRGLDGPRVHMGLIDELHEHSDPIVVNKIRAGTKGRRQALIFEITNSGFDKTTVCWQHHEYSEKVVKGLIENDTWFAYVCGLDEGDDWLNDESCWSKANPNLGVSITMEYLREQVNEARGMPAKQSLVARLNFCEWVGAENPWITEHLWQQVQEDFDLEEVRGWNCYLSADLSAKKDLTALGAIFENPDDPDDLKAHVWFFSPKDTLIERGREDGVGYDLWVKEGWITATPGRSVEYRYVAQKIGWVLKHCEVLGLAFDPWRIDDLLKAIEAEGIDVWRYEGPDEPKGDGLMLIKHGQAFTGAVAEDSLWMPKSVDTIEKLILHDEIRIKKNPVLNWCSANAVLTSDPAGNRKYDKKKATGRIDGIVALAMAAGLAVAPLGNGRSYLEDEGVLVL